MVHAFFNKCDSGNILAIYAKIVLKFSILTNNYQFNKFFNTNNFFKKL